MNKNKGDMSTLQDEANARVACFREYSSTIITIIQQNGMLNKHTVDPVVTKIFITLVFSQ